MFDYHSILIVFGRNGQALTLASGTQYGYDGVDHLVSLTDPNLDPLRFSLHQANRPPLKLCARSSVVP
jgi:hypothetical protein